MRDAQAEDIPSASGRRQHAGKDCKAQIGLLGQPIGAALDNRIASPAQLAIIPAHLHTTVTAANGF